MLVGSGKATVSDTLIVCHIIVGLRPEGGLRHQQVVCLAQILSNRLILAAGKGIVGQEGLKDMTPEDADIQRLSVHLCNYTQSEMISIVMHSQIDYHNPSPILSKQ